MDAEVFEMIAWNDREAALKGTSEMFKMWYAKQGSGFYGVGYLTSKCEGNVVSQCPSCRKLNERADHLNQCKNEARTAVFMDQINLIEEWMESGKHIHPPWFANLANCIPQEKIIAEEQDRIGWENFRKEE